MVPVVARGTSIIFTTGKTVNAPILQFSTRHAHYIETRLRSDELLSTIVRIRTQLGCIKIKVAYLM
jgi:hypothetical protein